MTGNWLLVLRIVFTVCMAHGCPQKCLCHIASKTTDCKNRGFTEIPAHLPPETQILQLQNNRIWRIHQNAFTGTPLLKILDLSNNSLSSFAPGAFQKLRYLQVLNLTRNLIHYIENKTFSFLPHLKELDLSSNSITRLPETFGNSTGNITLLSVKHNKLQKMERVLLESLPNLKVVLFKDNPWLCNCNVFGLKLWLESFLYRALMLERDDLFVHESDTEHEKTVHIACDVLYLQASEVYRPDGKLYCQCRDNGTFSFGRTTVAQFGDLSTSMIKLTHRRCLEPGFGFLYQRPRNKLLCSSLSWNTISIFGGISDGIICATPGIRKGKDLLKVPYELFGACPFTTAHAHLATTHHHGFEHRSSLKHSHHHEYGENSRPSCEPKPKPRPVSLRHAIATVVITGVVCGIVCLMMLAAAVYGCAYAAITAKYHREHLAPARQHGISEEKEPFDSSLA